MKVLVSASVEASLAVGRIAVGAAAAVVVVVRGVTALLWGAVETPSLALPTWELGVT